MTTQIMAANWETNNHLISFLRRSFLGSSRNLSTRGRLCDESRERMRLRRKSVLIQKTFSAFLTACIVLNSSTAGFNSE